ncbi:MAG: hypothetical protein U5J95_00545 [Balneolaceae bacterium]|nr:hypothetical protein [Balneolaceae bacterium]
MKKIIPRLLILIMATGLLYSCTSEKPGLPEELTWDFVQDSTHTLLKIDGFSGPEAVRYEPNMDVWFVSNFNGGGSDEDANGFISKVATDGHIDSLRFMTGTEQFPLHAPRGMYITGNTLWAADINGVHGFNIQTGKQTQFVDFTDFEPGFLNDIVQGADGNLYVTDTGKSQLYKIEEGTPSLVQDSLEYAPNGITLNPDSNKLVLAPWGGNLTFLQWSTSQNSISSFITVESGGYYDGIEFVSAGMIAASQQDSSLHLITKDRDDLVIHVPGRPADIGLDTKRMQVAVPYIALDRVDVWQLPKN